MKLQNYVFFIIIILIAFTSKNIPQSNSSITGTVKDSETLEIIPLVNITIENSQIGVAADSEGNFLLKEIETGIQTLIVSAVGYMQKKIKVNVVQGKSIEVNILLNKQAIEFNEIYVEAATLRKERVTESPASVSILDHDEIKRSGSHGQIPKLLEFEPGVDVAQSGLFDFNINSRGFNSSLNRRLLILLDGRDLGTAFLGATEWNGLSIPLEDMGRIELVRGPGSALYGANAYNGVINITSLPPKSNPGTRVTLGGGEMNTLRGDISHSGFSGNLSYRINAGGYQGESFSKSRINDFEYSGFNNLLNREVVPVDTDPIRTIYGSGRVDYDFNSNRKVTVEGGLAQVENEVVVTGIGRVQVKKATRPWGRLNYNGDGFNVLLWSNIRHNIEPEKSLSTNLDLIQNASISHGEIQYGFNSFDEKLFVIAGVSHRLISIDTKSTLMREKRDDNTSGIFGQLEYKLTENIKAVFAIRWDRSSLTASQFSPKAALVWSPVTEHNFRITFNKAFQPPNYSEQYLYVIHPARPLAYFGNPDLVPEKITGYEIGYKGIYFNKLFFTFDIYYSQMEDFVTDLGPSVNPEYSDPIVLPGENFSRTVWSYTNAGEVEEYGGEIAVNYYLNNYWLIKSNVSYYNFNVVEKNINDVLIPNTPDYKINLGITYTHPQGHSVSLSAKYVPAFDWAAGIFRGSIKAYTLLNLSGNFNFSDMITFNLSVTNLLNDQHYQIFGGSLLGRRALVTAIFVF